MSEKDVWVVATKDTATYIGRVASLAGGDNMGRDEAWGEPTKDSVVAAFLKNAVFTLSPCFNLFDRYAQQQTPTGLMMSHDVMALPIACTSVPEKSCHYLRPNTLVLITGQNPSDEAEYMRLVDQAVQMAEEQRMKRSNLQIPTGPGIRAPMPGQPQRQ